MNRVPDGAAPPRWRAPRMALDADADVAWVLRAAFRTADHPGGVEAPPDAVRAVDLLRRFGVSARTVERSGFEPLRDAVGADLARSLAVEQAATEARGLQILDLAQALAAFADGGLPPGGQIAFLKLAGLCLSSAARPGSRGGSDLDVLVAQRDAVTVRDWLQSEGFVASSIPAYEHQLPALVHPRRGMVEIHTHVPGVRLDGRRFARLNDLADAGELVAIEGWPAAASVPSAAFLAAHSVAHGVAQHGAAPASYPLFQMLADVIDLGELRGAGSRSPRWFAWLERDVARREAQAVLDLAAALAEGETPDSGDSRLLLDHLLAGILDADYRQSLKTDFAHSLSERWWPMARLGLLRRAMFPSQAELAGIYGPPSFGAFGRLGLRARRPFDALLRYGRAAVARRHAGSRME